jgi:recombinational DNA repair protein (RecF pathway)
MIIARPKAETRRNSKPNSDACARCRREAPTRGRFTQTIRGVKRFICAECCSTLSSVAALIAHAEAADLESQRQRFQTRRPADRRAA